MLSAQADIHPGRNDYKIPIYTKSTFERRGFTLIELMVVVLILALLLGILLPAISSSREAARRMACASNMRQIGIGILSYESHAGVLPSAWWPGNVSLHARILPFMDSGLTNVHDGRVQIDLFLCPSDEGRGRPSSWLNYPANGGYRESRGGLPGLFKGSTTPLADVTDGTSHTAAITEWVISPIQVPAPTRDRLSTPFDAKFNWLSSLSIPDQIEVLGNYCDGLNPNTAPLASLSKGQNWSLGQRGSSQYDHILPINSPSCTLMKDGGRGVWSAGSRHPNGANVLFLDGRVSFVKEEITRPIWRALGTRNGNEIIPDF